MLRHEYMMMREVKECPYVIAPLGFHRQNSVRATMVMEYAPGGELYALLEPNFGIEEDLARKVMAQLIDAVEFLHMKNIVHRDIKPENVVIGANGVAKLCDFGLADYAGSLTVAFASGNGFVGTLPYMAPELLEKKQGYLVSKAEDIWALGCLFYVLLTGDFPWLAARCSEDDYRAWANGDTSEEPWSMFTTRLIHLFKRTLAIDPTRRCRVGYMKHFIDQPFFAEEETSKERKADSLQCSLQAIAAIEQREALDLLRTTQIACS